MTGSPGFSRWMSVGTTVHYRESRDRLKPGLLSGNVRIRCSMFSRQHDPECKRLCAFEQCLKVQQHSPTVGQH